MNQHGFLGQVQQKKLYAVIQLLSQTLLLSVSDNASCLIGTLFHVDMVVLNPQVTGQQQQQIGKLQQNLQDYLEKKKDGALLEYEVQKKELEKKIEQSETQKNALKKELEQCEKQLQQMNERAISEQRKADNLVLLLEEERKMDSSYQENKRRRRLDPDPVKLPKFPFEIIIEILSWLPIVSLLRFKSVCKQWHTLITQDYKFIAKHMGRARPLRLVYEYKQLPKYAAIVFDKDYSFYDRFAGLFLERSLTSPVWRIRNPATHQVLYLPCDAHKGNYWQVECGFNSVTGECKLLCAYERNGSKIFGDETYEVFTVGKDRKWRPLKCSNTSLLKHGKWALTQLARVASKVDGVVHYMENITDGRDANLQVQSIDLWSECITTSTLPRGAFLDLNKVWAMSWNQYPAVADIVEGALNVLVLEDFREHKWSNLGVRGLQGA